MGWFEFEVPGDPVPQGSMVALKSKTTNHIFMKPSNEKKLKMYRQAVATCAMGSRKGKKMFAKEIPVSLRVTFVIKRPIGPKYDYPVQGDLDKFLRATGDAITGILIEDDAQIVEVMARKIYGLKPCTEVVVSRV